ncbi:MAG: hypothetical protein M3Z50_14760 [Actinomycetota bacterium]|nr:hypothetical protein [Actinomycetota bacterium]
MQSMQPVVARTANTSSSSAEDVATRVADIVVARLSDILPARVAEQVAQLTNDIAAPLAKKVVRTLERGNQLASGKKKKGKKNKKS